MTDVLSQIAPCRPGLLRTGLDPRLRLCMVAGFALVVSQLSSFAALGLALSASLALLGLSGQRIRPTLRRMASMDGFILFMLVLLPFTTPGTTLFTLWGFSASREGLAQALDILLTANAVVLMVLVLLGTLEPVTLGHALGRIGAPLALVHLLLFTLRYISVLEQEYGRMRQAMRARAFSAGTNLHTLTSLGYLVGMLLVRAHDRSARILQAMKCRGFDGQLPLIDEMRLRRSDVLAALGFAVLIVTLIVIEVFDVRAA